MSLSLYIHIPFCIKRCIYCDFVSGIYAPETAEAYVDALEQEIRGLPNSLPLSTLYIGGGTPTLLSKSVLAELISSTFNHFSFVKEYEATVEANPGTVSRGKLKSLSQAGINRISLGIQSFNNNELDFLGRIHSAKEAVKAIHMADSAGIKNIGIDLMYGIPGQSLEHWRTTLAQAVALKPRHISTYGLTIEKGTKLDKMLRLPPHFILSQGGQKGCTKNRLNSNLDTTPSVEPPNEESIIEMYEHAIDYLTSAGYIHYEISNFSIPGFECIHNLNYWKRGEYFGVGLGAHSFFRGKRFSNTTSLATYLKLISEGMRPAEKEDEITDETALSEALFLGLRMTEGICIESLARRYRINILRHYEKEIQALHDAGLIVTENSSCSDETYLRLTKKGLLLSNEVFTEFV